MRVRFDDPLYNMENFISISSDSLDQRVLVAAVSHGRSLLFRFGADNQPATSTAARILNCFNDKDAEAKETYESRSEMRQAIRETIDPLWHIMVHHPATDQPDAIVDIFGNGETWSICHDSSYTDFLAYLKKSEDIAVPLEALAVLDPLGGRGETLLVQNAHGEKYAWKGLTYRAYLERGAEYRYESELHAHEIEVLNTLPRHDRIASPPAMFTTTYNPMDSSRYICGFIKRYHPKGSLQDYLDSDRARISLSRKAKWAYQISSALAAVHAANNYHMDLKPSNILLTETDDIQIIDWEQCGASEFFLAPEADGSWDLVGRNPLQYKKFLGGQRRNTNGAQARPIWNVFPIWQKESPHAVMAAEVYSFGRVLWVIMDENVDLDDNSQTDRMMPVTWSCKDIPQAWRDFITRCTDMDANARPSFNEGVKFWEIQCIQS